MQELKSVLESELDLGLSVCSASICVWDLAATWACTQQTLGDIQVLQCDA